MTKNVITIDADSIKNFDKLISEHDKDVEIKGATLKDSFCSYSYELLKGPTKGDTLTHNGVHIIHDDLQEAFEKMNVFMANLDDAFPETKNTTTFEELEAQDEITEKYTVTGFKISGVEENRSVVLLGYKEVTRGIIKFETPKEKLNGNYLYLHQLKTRLFDLIDEVENYRSGKTAPQDDPNQVVMTFAQEDDAFENAKVD